MNRLRLGIFACLVFPLWSLTCSGQEEESQPAETWISSLAWLDDEQVVGSQSQGLLLRPAEVVTAKLGALHETTTLGESETSLWTVLPLGDGQVLATDYKGGVHLIGSDANEAIECETRWIRAVCIAPGDQEVLAGTEDGKLVVLSLQDKKETRRVDAHQAAIFDIAVSSAGDTIATVGGDGQVKLFSWPELEPKGEMSRGKEAIWAVAFANDDDHLITGGADRRLQWWDVSTGKSVCTITQTSDWITDLCILPGSTVIIAACMDGKLVVADSRALQLVTEVEAGKSAIWSMALHPDGKQIALGTRKHGFTTIDVADWQQQADTLAELASQNRPPSPK